ncbi:MAG: alpha/beta hydrolase [Bacteroidia bacterium]|nr:alpha/beta hydrolase [Bacteroidia bacterium]
MKIQYLLSCFLVICLMLGLLSCEEEVPTAEISFDTLPAIFENLDANYAADLSYGAFPENTFDIFLPKVSGPTPLIVFIHGGGFTGGDKDIVYNAASANAARNLPEEIRKYIDAGIAFATINYRLLDDRDQEGVLKPLGDSRRCLQYIRSIAASLNIDKEKIALTGNSAGAGTALWLSFHDDMKETGSDDPVLRESTRVLGAAVTETQASYDLKSWETHVFSDYDLQLEPLVNFDQELEQRFNSFYGISDFADFESPETQAYREEVDMLAWMTADDPEFWVSNTLQPLDTPIDLGQLLHHPYHARELLRKGNSIGLLSYVTYGPFADPGRESLSDYLIRICRE